MVQILILDVIMPQMLKLGDIMAQNLTLSNIMLHGRYDFAFVNDSRFVKIM